MDKLFPTHAKRQGAMLAKGFVPAIQFSELFTDHLYERLGRHGIDMAMELKKGLLEKGYALHIDSYTNQQFVILPEKVVQALRENVDFEVWERKDEDTLVVRFVTSWSTKKRMWKNCFPSCKFLYRVKAKEKRPSGEGHRKARKMNGSLRSGVQILRGTQNHHRMQPFKLLP